MTRCNRVSPAGSTSVTTRPPSGRGWLRVKGWGAKVSASRCFGLSKSGLLFRRIRFVKDRKKTRIGFVDASIYRTNGSIWRKATCRRKIAIRAEPEPTQRSACYKGSTGKTPTIPPRNAFTCLKLQYPARPSGSNNGLPLRIEQRGISRTAFASPRGAWRAFILALAFAAGTAQGSAAVRRRRPGQRPVRASGRRHRDRQHRRRRLSWLRRGPSPGSSCWTARSAATRLSLRLKRRHEKRSTGTQDSSR